MGYTHYIRTTTPPTEPIADLPIEGFAKLSAAARRLVDYVDFPIGGGFGEVGTQPEITSTLISLNGLGEDSHETFYFPIKPDDFSFCKTARKPYDRLVTALLCLADLYCPNRLEITSDGGRFDWGEGAFLARTVDPRAQIPAGIVND